MRLSSRQFQVGTMCVAATCPIASRVRVDPGLHGEIRRVPGALSLASTAKPGQTLIVPAGNEKECALILAKPGHENCRVAGVSTLDEVVDFFRGKGKLDNALREAIHFEDAVPRATDFGVILGQERAKEAAV